MAAAFATNRWNRVTPLGVRFVDDQHGGFVVGLSVVAWPAGEPSRRIVGRLNKTQVYLLFDLPGLRDVEFGAGDAAYWATVRHKPFVVEVSDPEERFLRFRFTADLPVEGLLRLTCGSPATPAPLPVPASDGVPLFTSPTRPAAPGITVVRADLWDPIADAPAAWAMVELSTARSRALGVPPLRAIADDRGCIAIHVPCPDEQEFDGGSFGSPGAGGVPLSARTWSVDLAASYGRLRPPRANGATAPSAQPIPDLCRALAQPPALLWSDSARTLPLTRVTLHYSHELILRSSASGAARPSVLFVTPSGSPS
jgi:hypothetical protein